MYPAFTGTMACSRVEDLRRAAARERLAARARTSNEDGPSRLRAAVGTRLVQTGLRLLRTA